LADKEYSHQCAARASHHATALEVRGLSLDFCTKMGRELVMKSTKASQVSHPKAN